MQGEIPSFVKEEMNMSKQKNKLNKTNKNICSSDRNSTILGDFQCFSHEHSFTDATVIFTFTVLEPKLKTVLYLNELR